jgi:putative ABC transport system permease protein
MNLSDVVDLAARALTKAPRRTLLSLSGVAIGTASVIVLTALGEGARVYVEGQFLLLGSNSVIVLPGKSETQGALPGMGGIPNDLTLQDAEALLRGVPQVLRLAPLATGPETISWRGRDRMVVAFGTTREIQTIRDLHVSEGTFLPEVPWDRSAPVAVLGSTVAKELFQGENPIGAALHIGGFRVRVIGVLEPKGMHMGFDMDEVVFLPVASVMQMFDRSSLFRVIMDLKPGAEPEVAKQRVIEILAERHGEEDVTVWTQDAVMGSLTAILAVLTLALTGIAAISLTVAGIGIMNVMLVSVTERTSEIGLLKAIGAAPRQILGLFLAEAVLLSLAGGVAGILIGTSLVRAATLLMPSFPAQAPLWAILGALGVATVVGVFFGMLPARRAVRLDPVVALGRKGA